MQREPKFPVAHSRNNIISSSRALHSLPKSRSRASSNACGRPIREPCPQGRSRGLLRKFTARVDRARTAWPCRLLASGPARPGSAAVRLRPCPATAGPSARPLPGGAVHTRGFDASWLFPVSPVVAVAVRLRRCPTRRAPMETSQRAGSGANRSQRPSSRMGALLRGLRLCFSLPAWIE